MFYCVKHICTYFKHRKSMREGRHHRSASEPSCSKGRRTEMDLLPSSPTVPAGGSKHRRLGSYALPRTTEIPGSKRWELTHRIKTDSSHTIRWKTKERDQYDLKQPFPRKSLTSDHTPCLRTSQCCWGHRSLVAHSDIPFLRFTSKEQLRIRPRCVCSPSTFSPQPPFPAICHLPAMMNIWALKYVSGLRMGHVPSILGSFFLPTPYRSQPLPVINTRTVETWDGQTSERDSRVLLSWVLLLSSSLMAPMTHFYQPSHWSPSLRED